eukprot:gnl/MRDRNA2_/MRDRNA2_249223_c0_seq1.p1 gnl/MRDRNA2_/MRDRNA2_249223_c0~~gnl/MRDRNA2_/MRDRNA2_249223_c0_seq1.p1  ORF type:complete len:117 (+),score=5.99 gnl/MRDRNA2_/MRDRNA2_249223_c0_seq1:24-353(+)
MPRSATANFSWEDGSMQSQDGVPMFDLILLNPPFHQRLVVDEALALGLFRSAAGKLTESGQLWVVCNRHLPHQKALKTLFLRCERVAEGPKFMLLRAERPRRRRRSSQT